jgi:hypothetical protein
MSYRTLFYILMISSMISCATSLCSLVITFNAMTLQHEHAMVENYIPPGSSYYHYVGPTPPSYSRHLNSSDCLNKVTRITVPAGGTVWGTIKAQVLKDYSPVALPPSNQEVEELTRRTVDFLQAEINEDLSLKVRDLNVVPVGYQIDLAQDTSVSPVPGQ